MIRAAVLFAAIVVAWLFQGIAGETYPNNHQEIQILDPGQ